MKRTKLIILRGPSGSGKSTIARKLFKTVKRPTVLIEQDHYRFMFKPPGGELNSKTIHEMILQNTLSALRAGYDVILEGIFNVKSYKETLEKIFAIHKTGNYMFMFDISFEETLRRHRKKPNKDDWSETDMKAWYHPKDFMGYGFEQVITEDSSITQTLAKIKKVADI